jgi:hypothetical protein
MGINGILPRILPSAGRENYDLRDGLIARTNSRSSKPSWKLMEAPPWRHCTASTTSQQSHHRRTSSPLSNFGIQTCRIWNRSSFTQTPPFSSIEQTANTKSPLFDFARRSRRTIGLPFTHSTSRRCHHRRIRFDLLRHR